MQSLRSKKKSDNEPEPGELLEPGRGNETRIQMALIKKSKSASRKTQVVIWAFKEENWLWSGEEGVGAQFVEKVVSEQNLEIQKESVQNLEFRNTERGGGMSGGSREG